MNLINTGSITSSGSWFWITKISKWGPIPNPPLNTIHITLHKLNTKHYIQTVQTSKLLTVAYLIHSVCAGQDYFKRYTTKWTKQKSNKYKYKTAWHMITRDYMQQSAWIIIMCILYSLGLILYRFCFTVSLYWQT